MKNKERKKSFFLRQHLFLSEEFTSSVLLREWCKLKDFFISELASSFSDICIHFPKFDIQSLETLYKKVDFKVDFLGNKELDEKLTPCSDLEFTHCSTFYYFLHNTFLNDIFSALPSITFDTNKSLYFIFDNEVEKNFFRTIILPETERKFAQERFFAKFPHLSYLTRDEFFSLNQTKEVELSKTEENYSDLHIWLLEREELSFLNSSKCSNKVEYTYLEHLERWFEEERGHKGIKRASIFLVNHKYLLDKEPIFSKFYSLLNELITWHYTELALVSSNFNKEESDVFLQAEREVAKLGLNITYRLAYFDDKLFFI